MSACPKKAAPGADAAAEAAAAADTGDAAAEAAVAAVDSAAPLDSAAASASASASAAKAAPVATVAVGQVYSGSYQCAKPMTMSLTITKVAGTNVSAILEYRPEKLKAGTYKMSGTFTPGSRALVLNAGEWIAQPSSGTKVNLDGTLSADGKTYSGKAISTGCSTFSVKR